MGKTYSQLPSKILGVSDSWAAFQVDTAILTVGGSIENLAQERVNEGSDQEPKWTNRYQMSELLRADFRVQSDFEDPGDDLDVTTIDGIKYDEVR